LKDTNFPYT